MKKKKKILIISIVSILILLVIVVPLSIHYRNLNRWKNVDVNNVMMYLQNLQDIAYKHNDSRTSNTGYNESVIYVKNKLEEYKNYFQVDLQYFTYLDFIEIDPPMLMIGNRKLANKVEFQNMRFSGNGNFSNVHVKDVGVGCTDDDWKDFPKDGSTVAMIDRDDLKVCNIQTKIGNAVNHSALAVIVYNIKGSNWLFQMGLSGLAPFPVFAVGYDIGYEIINLVANASISMYSHNTVKNTSSCNVIADTKSGRGDRIIVSGSHLDSVAAGPGINDNGSGSATNLEIALTFAKANHKLTNKVRFIWFGAEELGLLGSYYYVESLNKEEIGSIALNLNFDMLASPNFKMGVYNGSDHSVASHNIQKVFEKYFKDNNVSYELSTFDGRSDYGPFLEKGIPAGGLETGAEGIKTLEQYYKYGGIPYVAFDPCYHSHCDSVENINKVALNNNLKAADYTIGYLSGVIDLAKFLAETP